MPYGDSLLSSPNPFTRANGCMALPKRVIADAVPIVIEICGPLRNGRTQHA